MCFTKNFQSYFWTEFLILSTNNVSSWLFFIDIYKKYSSFLYVCIYNVFKASNIYLGSYKHS